MQCDVVNQSHLICACLVSVSAVLMAVLAASHSHNHMQTINSQTKYTNYTRTTHSVALTPRRYESARMTIIEEITQYLTSMYILSCGFTSWNSLPAAVSMRTVPLLTTLQYLNSLGAEVDKSRH